MSPLHSSSQGPYRKPRADLYTVLLIMAVLAILLSILFLYWEVADYGDNPFGGAAAASLQVERPTLLARADGCLPARLHHLAATDVPLSPGPL